jgi:hypothetical protein
MTKARVGQTATRLANGRVLVVGGGAEDNTLEGGPRSATAELYDPSTATWTATGSMIQARKDFTATLLRDGRVLVTGGCACSEPGSVATAELYDPDNGTWTATGSMVDPRIYHTATVLADGKVLVAGGLGGGGSLSALDSAELYDPTAGTWSSTGNMTDGRESHTATLLQGGRVLVVGGVTVAGLMLASAELYDLATGTWSATGNMGEAASGRTTTLLEDGTVLAVGGYGGLEMTAVELYDPSSGTWSAAPVMIEGRSRHTATLLLDGTVLVAGGSGTSGPLGSAERYAPDGVT